MANRKYLANHAGLIKALALFLKRGETMNISIQKLLLKIEEQVAEAKNSHSENVIRERVHTIKSLCELILEDQAVLIEKASEWTTSSAVPNPAATSQMLQPKKIEIEKGVNGDSLLDF
ncbi:YwdI family protein [Bacillus sp. 03113]|uniref:YwdI family protein n=1 Tax=Bacillus sp. 03113 TaxID=2578211 RepID=UPI00215B88A9|nr:YwdI family protein [Bacillus sp. 03113]